MRTSIWTFGTSPFRCLLVRCLALLTLVRGTRFTLSKDEVLTLPEFVLLSLFPNGLLPDGHTNSFAEGDVNLVDVRASLPWTSTIQADTTEVRSGEFAVHARILPPRRSDDPITIPLAHGP